MHSFRQLRSRLSGRRIIRLGVFLAAALALAPRRGAADECGFGPLLPDDTHRGTVVHRSGVGDEYVADIAVQGDGRILTLTEINEDFAITRYLRDGSVDRTFGSFGTTVIDFDGRRDYPARIVVAGGRLSTTAIYVAGTAGFRVHVDAEGDFALAKLDLDGRLDRRFGRDGKVITGFGDDEKLYDLSLAPGGKIVVAGYHNDCGFLGGCDYDIALARYNSDGSLDRTFHGDGKVTTDPGDSAMAYSVAVSLDGSILVGGGYFASGGRSVLVRYEEDGSRDRSFGDNGIEKPLPSALVGAVFDLVTLADSSYLALTPHGVYQVFADGSVNEDFGGGFGFGRVTEDARRVMWVPWQQRFYVVGKEGCDAMVYRYHMDGRLDERWGDGGELAIDFAPETTRCSTGTALAVNPRGIVVGGYARGGGVVQGLAMLDWDGELVTGCNGPVEPEPEPGPDPVEPPSSVIRFIRGDSNGSSSVDLSDAITGLNVLFLGQEAPGCLSALDANDDGQLNVSDPAFLLNYLFVGSGDDLPPPATCGIDPTPDELRCESSSSCDGWERAPR